METLFSLKEKRAIISGGAGGIGSTMAEGLLKVGAKVVLLDVSDQVFKVAESLAAYGFCKGVKGDLLDREEREKDFHSAAEMLGGVDILVNTAGIQYRSDFESFPEDSWDRVIDINLNVAASLCRLAGQYMIPQRSGKIVSLASMNSYFGGTKASAYAASKGAIVQMTKAIANEWSALGINANCIAPGFIESPLTKDMIENEEVYNYKLGRIPMGRWGKPADLVGPLLFLCSPASDYVCGATIPVDGGYLCK